MTNNKKILAINAGSSSIKFKIFDANDFAVIASGLCERIFVDGHFKMKYDNNQKTVEFDQSMPDHEQATQIILNTLKQYHIIENLEDIVGIGHRCVQCGTRYSDSTVIDQEVIDVMKHYTKLAPLHNDPEIKVIEVFKKLLPNVLQVAAFDTSFHTTMPEVN